MLGCELQNNNRIINNIFVRKNNIIHKIAKYNINQIQKNKGHCN